MWRYTGKEQGSDSEWVCWKFLGWDDGVRFRGVILELFRLAKFQFCRFCFHFLTKVKYL